MNPPKHTNQGIELIKTQLVIFGSHTNTKMVNNMVGTNVKINATIIAGMNLFMRLMIYWV